MGDGIGSGMTVGLSVDLESSCNGAGEVRFGLDCGVELGIVPFCFVTGCFRLKVVGVDTVRDKAPGLGDTEVLEAVSVAGSNGTVPREADILNVEEDTTALPALFLLCAW